MPEWVHCDIYFSVDCSSTPKHTVSSPHVAFLSQDDENMMIPSRLSFAPSPHHLCFNAMQAYFLTSLLLFGVCFDVWKIANAIYVRIATK